MELPRQCGKRGLEIATSPAPPCNDKAGEEWVFVVEDVKTEGTRTREYSMKRKLLAERFGIQIREI
jgi:hypothetical protein